jgi:uncharacterized protein YndB with AHSA1/START domain
MDFSKAFGASFREVDSGTRDGRPTHIVRMRRSYPTTPDDLWNAMTDKERICRWFAEVSGDLKHGGRFSIKGNAQGEITICEPPNALALTWEVGDNTSWVTVTVENAEIGAVLTLEHELPTDEKSAAFWDQYGPGATGVGWELAILGLDAHLSSDGQPSLEAGAAWAEGAQGKAMLRTWANAWGEAYVSSGAPGQTARRMAERTAGFYTGEG